MKQISSTLLALFFAFLCLICLILVNRSADSALVTLDDQPKVSELGLRFTLRR